MISTDGGGLGTSTRSSAAAARATNERGGDEEDCMIQESTFEGSTANVAGRGDRGDTPSALAAEPSPAQPPAPPQALPPRTAAPVVMPPAMQLQLPPEFGFLPTECAFAETPSALDGCQPVPTPHTPAPPVFEGDVRLQVGRVGVR
jgi:hypothetical protein